MSESPYKSLEIVVVLVPIIAEVASITSSALSISSGCVRVATVVELDASVLLIVIDVLTYLGGSTCHSHT